jgi:hypothetical protein
MFSKMVSWQDDNLPLQYQFSYFSPTVSSSSEPSSSIIKSLSEPSFVSGVTLPAGSSVEAHIIHCVAEIYDSYGANNSAFTNIQVKPSVSNSSSSHLLESYFNQSQQALKSSNVDAIKQAANINTYLLNRVDCSLAPNCSSLLRHVCSTTPQTCGACLSSNYVGTSGDSNDPCYRNEEDMNTALSTTKINKACVASCSGHGICQFLSLLTKDILNECLVNDDTCAAVCKCDSDYDISFVATDSSSTCDISKEELASRKTYRESVIQGIASMTSIEAPSLSSVAGWVDYLVQATRKTSELSSTSGALALSLVNNITKVVTTSGDEINSASISNSLKILDSVAKTVTSSSSFSSRRQLTGSSTEGITDLQQAITNYAFAISSSLVAGESPVSQTTTNIKLTTSSLSCESNPAFLTVPDSGSSLLLSSCESKSNVQLVAYTISSSLYTSQSVSSYESNPLTLSLSSNPCSDSEDETCDIILTLKRNIDSVGVTVKSAASSFATVLSNHHNTTCTNGDYSTHVYQCPNGLNDTIHCNGTHQLIMSKCPVMKSLPACKLIFNGDTYDSNSCRMISYTNDNVTCECSLASAVAFNRRRLAEMTMTVGNTSLISQQAITVSYVSMLETVVDNAERTVLSVQDLSDKKVAKGWQALVVIGVLFTAIIAGLYTSYQADKKSRKIVASEVKKGKDSLSSRRMSSIVGRRERESAVGPAGNRSSFSVRKESVFIESGQNLYELAEETLPSILQSSSNKTWREKMLHEMKRHHRWLGIAYHYSETFPRMLRVLSLSSNVIIMLFVQSLTYDLNRGDDGSCERLTNEEDCLVPRSTYATGASRCYWTPPPSSSPNGGSCSYVQPNDSIQVILFVAIFCAILSTPLALIADWIIIHILAAPDLNELQLRRNKLSKISDINSFAIVPRDSTREARESLNRRSFLTQKLSTIMKKTDKMTQKEEQELKEIQEQLKSLKKEIQEYRLGIVDLKERKEFDGKEV